MLLNLLVITFIPPRLYFTYILLLRHIHIICNHGFSEWSVALTIWLCVQPHIDTSYVICCSFLLISNVLATLHRGHLISILANRFTALTFANSRPHFMQRHSPSAVGKTNPILIVMSH